MSLGIALPVFVYGENELIDLELTQNLSCEKVRQELQKSLPELIIVKDVKKLTPPYNSIESMVEWADYKITPLKKAPVSHTESTPEPVENY